MYKLYAYEEGKPVKALMVGKELKDVFEFMEDDNTLLPNQLYGIQDSNGHEKIFKRRERDIY
jgi:hypothetical protein